MIDKRFTLPGKIASGAPLIHLVEPGTRYGLNKTAGLSGEHMPEVQELVESISPKPGRIYLLNSALGAGEFVGNNMRGDLFTERGLLHTPPGWAKIPVWDIDARRKAAAEYTEVVGTYGPRAWGYPTFYNAHRFRNHQNQDPARAHGFIIGAFYDHRMHRVILVSELIEDNCVAQGSMDIYRRIKSGEFVDTSMGANVPYDECNICWHRAKTPAEYCEHVRRDAVPPFGMNVLLPDGRRCGVWNYHPRFFDDSFVVIGAERSAKIMADLTPEIRGENDYGQHIYRVGGGLKLAAGAFTDKSDRGPTELDLMAQRTRDEIAAARALPSRTAGERLAQIMVRPEPDRTPKEKKEERLIRGVLGTPKQAAIKLSEMFKRLPSPTAPDLHALRALSDEQPDIPKTLLPRLMPHLGALAHMGVILRPHEFQYGHLSSVHPEIGEQMWDHDLCCMSPIEDEDVEPYPAPTAFAREGIADLLGSLLDARSILPGRVVIQITIRRRPKMIDVPELSSVGRAYNTYRGRALATHMPAEGKVAHADAESFWLLALADWPSVRIGGANADC